MPKKFSKIFPIIVLFGILILGSLYKIYHSKKQSTKNICDHCNILLIDIDTLRADALPCYGYQRNTAPNICAFAEKSVIFNHNYSTAYWTLPSIFSTITSLYPTFHRVRTPYIDKLSSDKTTLAKILRDQGYQTAFVGPTDNTSTLTKENGGLIGYDLVTNEAIDEVVAKLSKKSKPWFIHYYDESLHMPYLIPEGVSPIENLVPPKNLPTTQTEFDILLNTYLKKHYSEVFQKKAINQYSSIIFSDQKNDSTNLTELFYKLYKQQYLDQEKEGYLIDVWMPIYKTYMETFDQKNPSDIAYLRMMYDTMISQIDLSLTPLFKKLNSRSLSKNTIIIINSDHGEAFGDYGTFGHEGNYHSESFHTPLIIHSPNLSKSVIEETSGNIDIFPTIMQLVGINIPSGLQGQSLISFLDNQKNDLHRFVFSESHMGITYQNKNWLYFLPNRYTDFRSSVLHDKNSDPDEKINIAKKYPELTKSLYEQVSILLSYEESLQKKEASLDLNILKIDPEKLERLKKEGYF
jgi:arylsulfatase A-like enzyme